MITMPSDLLEQRELVERYLKESPQPLSSFSFVNLFIWKDFFNFELRNIGGALCIFASDQAGTFLYLPPLGKKAGREVIDDCLVLMRERNKGSGVSRIENVPAAQLIHFPPEQFKCFAKGDEYCYYKKDLVELKGNNYKSKRGDYNYFTKHYRAAYRAFAPADAPECLALYDRWAAARKKDARDETYLYMLEDNRQVHAAVFKHGADLGLTGRVVEVDGKIAAYTFGYALNKYIFCVLGEIADVTKKGLPVYIFSQFCDDPDAASFRFINVMDDFALENIQKAKMSFHPTMLFSSFTISPQS